MGGSKSKNKDVNNTTTSDVNMSISPKIMQRRLRVPGNYCVIWLSALTGLTNEDNTRALTELQKVVSNLYTCAEYNKCFDFIMEHEHEKVIRILSTTIEKIRVQQIHDMPQIHSIYIYGNTTSSYAISEFNKIQGIHEKIKPICEALSEIIWQSSQSHTSISVRIRPLSLSLFISSSKPFLSNRRTKTKERTNTREGSTIIITFTHDRCRS